MAKVDIAINARKATSCSGKQGHDTVEKADKHRKYLRKTPGGKNYRIYKCKYCGKFHAGKRRKK